MCALAVPHLPSRGMQTQCSFSGRAGWQSQTSACKNVPSLPSRTVAFASGIFEQSHPISLLENMDVKIARMQRSFLEIEKQMATELREIDKRAHEMQNAHSARSMNPNGSQTYRNEQHFEHRTGDGYFRDYRSETITYYGQPSAPLVHQHIQPGMQTRVASLGVLALMFLVGTYLAVVTRLAAAWEKTRYSAAEAARVIPLWPFLAAFSTSFRREVRRALGGREVGMDGGDEERA